MLYSGDIMFYNEETIIIMENPVVKRTIHVY
jgi:hypothetical protein